MRQQDHVADRLGAWLAGTLPEAEAAELRRHLDSCAGCAEERDLLREGMSIVPPLPVADARPGFAARAAARAARPRSLAPPWLRWALAGGVAAAAAGAAVLIARPARAPGDEIVVAQRLDLFEDLNVVQNQDALRDLEVVAVLHTLQPEGKP
jgi:anti-sigma factor RsiW